MKHVDAVRGYERTILFESTGGHKTSGGVEVTGCVVEIVENDTRNWEAQKLSALDSIGPALSLRFYNRPMPLTMVEEAAKDGTHICDEETPIGVEITLGRELALSVFQQISDQWPAFLKLLQGEQ